MDCFVPLATLGLLAMTAPIQFDRKPRYMHRGEAANYEEDNPDL
jgi:hypothetical protein